jgi:predicted nucleotidyltransferase
MVTEISRKTTVSYLDDIPFIVSTILSSVTNNIIKKIIIFGSYAYEGQSKDSDIDICVIITNNKNSRTVYLNIALALFYNKITPADLLVYREKDFTYGIQKNKNGIESVIDSSGKVLYVQK